MTNDQASMTNGLESWSFFGHWSLGFDHLIPLVYVVRLALYNRASARFYGVTDHADWP